MANIFLKVCPECARANTVAAASCTCGYVFEAQEPQARVSTQDIAREERLYEEYLAVRAAQAVEAARVAKHLAELFPQDRQKLIAAAELELAAQTAEAELAAQKARVADVMESLQNEINAIAGDSTASQAA
jgi:hypothetical protein